MGWPTKNKDSTHKFHCFLIFLGAQNDLRRCFYVGHMGDDMLLRYWKLDPKRAGFLPNRAVLKPWAQGLKIPCASPCRTSEKLGNFRGKKPPETTKTQRKSWKALWFQRLEKPSFGKSWTQIEADNWVYFLSMKMMCNSLPNKISSPTSLASSWPALRHRKERHKDGQL